MLPSELSCVLLLTACLFSTAVRAQLLDCNFQEVDLVPCLAKPSETTIRDCCLALNHALEAGQHCLCSVLALSNLQLLASTGPLLPSPPPLLTLVFSSCNISSPSLVACGVPFELNLVAPPPPLLLPPIDDKEHVRTPMVTAAVPTSKGPSANATRAQTPEPQLAANVPKSSDNIAHVLDTERHTGSTFGRPKMWFRVTATFLLMTVIYVWIV